MIVLRSTLRAAQADAEKHRKSARDSEAEVARLRTVLDRVREDRDQWRSRARDAWRGLAAARADLDSAPRCMHGTWPCSRENCSRGRYAAGLARALELAGGQPESGSDEAGAAARGAGGAGAEPTHA
jgi:hypothetical protein